MFERKLLLIKIIFTLLAFVSPNPSKKVDFISAWHQLLSSNFIFYVQFFKTSFFPTFSLSFQGTSIFQHTFSKKLDKLFPIENIISPRLVMDTQFYLSDLCYIRIPIQQKPSRYVRIKTETQYWNSHVRLATQLFLWQDNLH